MNPFRQLLKSAGAHPPVGTWIMSASPLVAEATGHAGFDWAVIDMEHSPLDMMDVLQMMQALSSTKMVPIVRVAWNPGDLVLFDNRITQHYAPDDYGDLPRVLHRVTVAGDVPVGVDGGSSRILEGDDAGHYTPAAEAAAA